VKEPSKENVVSLSRKRISAGRNKNYRDRMYGKEKLRRTLRKPGDSIKELLINNRR